LIFIFPEPQAERRHGPGGYAEYKHYRPWLRDEFDFRCVYCLKRETWGQVTFDFELDHFQPQSLNPHLKLAYRNLVYACRRCNAVKRDQKVADPSHYLQRSLVTTQADGTLVTQDVETRRLILQLDLNSPKLKSWRVMWMRIVDLAEECDRNLYLQLTGFPDYLPDLAKLRPPQNSRINGLEESWFAMRQNGQLPDTY
jgi:hypothetical protein